jgi:hypothetical protein
MKIIEVKEKTTSSQFLDVVNFIYKNDKNYIRPLDVQITEIFDPKKNEFFKHGEATRFILIDDNNQTIGRIGAFINNEKAYGFDQPTGGCGFFECINNQDAANILFDAAKKWLSDRGMQAMDGPVNFGENDNFWGLLVDGFTPPAIGMQYNPPYYKTLFETYGFLFYFEQVTNNLDLTKPFPERFWKIAEWVAQKPEFRIEHFQFKNAAKYLNNIMEVYQAAWEFHENFKPMSAEDVKAKLKSLKSILIEDFVWFAYAGDEPIAFLVMLPDLNQIIKHLDGKLNLWNKLKFVYLKSRKTITRSRIVIMGVKPKYQKIGIESAIFWNIDKAMQHHKEYTDVELSWVGDFNPKMRALHESVGATFVKRHITYRCLFDESKAYHRSTIIPVDTKEKVIQKEKNS